MAEYVLIAPYTGSQALTEIKEKELLEKAAKKETFRALKGELVRKFAPLAFAKSCLLASMVTLYASSSTLVPLVLMGIAIVPLALVKIQSIPLFKKNYYAPVYAEKLEALSALQNEQRAQHKRLQITGDSNALSRSGLARQVKIKHSA